MNNNRAYSEVYQIIQYLPENEYIRIPKEKIKFLEENMDKNVEKICTITTSMEQIKLSEEAKIIFLNLFYNYIANDTQKRKLKKIIENKQKENLADLYNKIFTNTQNKKENINKDPIIIKKENIFNRIKNVIIKLKNKFYKQK